MYGQGGAVATPTGSMAMLPQASPVAGYRPQQYGGPQQGYQQQGYPGPQPVGSMAAQPVNSSACAQMPPTPNGKGTGRGLDGASSAQPMSSQQGMGRSLQPSAVSNGPSPCAASPPMSREKALEQKVAELSALLERKDQDIKDLQTLLTRAGMKVPALSGDAKKARARDRGTGFKKLSESQPAVPYEAFEQEDPVDMRLEEFYNGTGSAIPFRRINKGFYKFGETILELNIINHKLMARTEDGWNRNKFGPIEKFVMYYENIEREKAGLAPEH
ncbi:unnamed protein product [Polarella glacialis]|uniref:Uncharacterized protein n=1 Tax=Polarella glacialis TaxID=89957 RepID=A0A813HVQ5_POLGL|nr:unnamed protein product [Polarella glacialis]